MAHWKIYLKFIKIFYHTEEEYIIIIQEDLLDIMQLCISDGEDKV